MEKILPFRQRTNADFSMKVMATIHILSTRTVLTKLCLNRMLFVKLHSGRGIDR
jgi:hypothetical protein